MKKRIIGLLFLTCLMSGCQKDLYDPTYNPDLNARVPENFEWSTTQTLNVNVEVNDEYNGKYYYAVRVYDRKPGEGVLPVAASSKVNKDFPFLQKIVVPATVSKLYVVQAFKNADASEVITEREIAINGGNMACSFGSGSSKRSVSTRAKDDEIERTEKVVKVGEIYEITGEQKQINIRVERGGELRFTEGGELFQCEINIEYGGEMTASDGVTLTLKNSSLYNYGEVRIYNIDFNNGSTLYNGDAAEGKNEGGCFYANHITLTSGHGRDKRYLGERSYTSCEQLTLDKVKLTLKTSAWLKCNVLSSNGGACTLQGEGSTIGTTGYVGLATIGKIEGGLTIMNNILVECANTSIKQDNVVKDATGKIQIVGTTCNDGGFGDVVETKPGEYTYIFEDQYPEPGDYDMNDIVVSMTAIQKGETLTIVGYLKAVGAALPIIPYVKVGDETKPLFIDNDGEAHAALGSTETSSPINTMTEGINLSAESFNLVFDNVTDGLTVNDLDFYIKIGEREIHWDTQEGNATWGMRIPGLDFKWPKERVKITAAYPDFTKWFEDPSFPWYESPSKERTY